MRSGNFVMIRQERVAVRRETWEFPAGQVDGMVTADAILATAHRELGEEAGLRCAGELVPLGMVFSSVGFTTECCHLFLAPEVVPAPELTSHDAHEAIHEVREFSTASFRAAVADGSISDCNTLAVFARMAALDLL
jgi:8-oxo-dGTP pyrophosphatase MutT (NUDIX family)